MKFKTLTIIFGATTLILGSVLTYIVLTNNPSSNQERNDQSQNKPEANKPEPQEPTDDVKDQSWKLISGNPDDTCTSPTFTGSAKIKGWYSYETGYIEKEWLFKVQPSELDKLPVDQLTSGGESLFKFYKESPAFNIINATPELEQRLKNATESSPIELTFTKFTQYCEGRGMLTVQ